VQTTPAVVATTPTTVVKPPPPPPQTTPTVEGVHQGAFCAQSQHYWYGHTSTGLLMQCKPSATDTAFRWRQA
jgi:hypothetical protein